MIIDMHVHLSDKRIYPEYWLNGIRENITKKIEKENGIKVSEGFINEVLDKSLNDLNCSKLISQMDNAEVDKAVVLLVDLGYEREDNFLEIEEIFKIHHQVIKENGNRLSVFAGIDPRRGKKGVDLFEKGIREYGFCGLKIYPPCGFEIDDVRLYDYYEICNSYSIPVLAHVGTSLPSMKASFNYPDSVLRVADEFKHIPFIMGHAALLFYEESCELPLKRENIYLETSGFQKISHKRGLLDGRVKSLFKKCPDNLLFGTDWPVFSDTKKSVQYFIEHGGITDSQKEKFFYKNALNIFSMTRI